MIWTCADRIGTAPHSTATLGQVGRLGAAHCAHWADCRSDGEPPQPTTTSERVRCQLVAGVVTDCDKDLLHWLAGRVPFF